jgi:hypothetical protein
MYFAPEPSFGHCGQTAAPIANPMPAPIVTVQQLQANLGAGAPESHVEGAVPGEVTYRSVDELRKVPASFAW